MRERQLTAHQGGEQARDGQPQPGAGLAGAAARRAALERHEDALGVLRCHAAAGVDDVEAQHVMARIHMQRDLSRGGEAHAIAKQVDENLAQPFGVRAHPLRQLSRHGVVERESLVFGLRTHHVFDFFQQLGQRQRRALQLQSARLDACEIEQTIDQAEHVLATLVDGGQRLAWVHVGGAVLQQNLRIAEDAVERCAQLVRDAGDVAGLGDVGEFGGLFCGLQCRVRAVVRRHFLGQQLVVPVRFFLRQHAAFAGQNNPPRAHQRQQGEQRKHLDEGPLQKQRAAAGHDLLRVDNPHDGGHQCHQKGGDEKIVRHAKVEPPRDAARKEPVHPTVDLLGRARAGFAAIAAARFECAAERANGGAVGRAPGHVFRFERVLADRAVHGLPRCPARADGACEVVFSLRDPRDQRRAQERGEERNEGRKGLQCRAEDPCVGRDAQGRCNHRGAQSHGVEIVQMGALEFDVAWAQAQWLVDHQIGHQRAHPGNRNVAVKTQHLLERTERAQRHQQHRNQHVEHQPDHAPGMAVGEPRKEIRPGERARVGIGEIDLELRDDDKDRRHRQHPRRVVQHVGETDLVHVRRLHRLRRRNLVLQRDEGQKRTAHHLDHARHDPTGSGNQHRAPPAHAVLLGLLGQKAQVVDLFANLHHQRKRNPRTRTKHQRIEVVAARNAAGQRLEFSKQLRRLQVHADEGQRKQQHPDGLRPQLQRRDEGDAAHHQRNDHQR